VAIILAVVSAAALTLAFPGTDRDVLAWVALAPLITVVTTVGPGRAYVMAGIAGLGFFAGFFSWIWALPGFNLIDFVLLELYFAQYFALFGLLLSLVTRRGGVPTIVAAPVLWVSLEFLRSHLSFLALPMALLGHSQYRQLALIQVASVTGVYGLSFLIVLVNAVLADLAGRLVSASGPPLTVRAWRSWARLLGPVAVAALILGVTALHGVRVLATGPEGARLTVGVLQRDLPPRIDLARQALSTRLDGYLELSRRLARDGPELVVWPETAMVGPLQRLPTVIAPIADLARSLDSHVLLGSAETRKFTPPEGPQRAAFNSAVLVSPGGAVVGSYDKVRLVPFGEYRPLAGLVTWPAWLVAGTDQLTPGAAQTIFHLRGARFGVVICWESLFPDLVRTLVRQGADFVVNITNESWFRGSAAPRHLAAVSVFRAVEHRIPLVRSANGGMSGIVDAYGRTTGSLEALDQPGATGEAALAGTIAIHRQPTFYTRHGDLAAWLCAGTSVIAVGVALGRRRAGP
jgi:apolipoprotein N-acyltransferase